MMQEMRQMGHVKATYPIRRDSIWDNRICIIVNWDIFVVLKLL